MHTDRNCSARQTESMVGRRRLGAHNLNGLVLYLLCVYLCSSVVRGQKQAQREGNLFRKSS
jgi:hypothetical protein